MPKTNIDLEKIIPEIKRPFIKRGSHSFEKNFKSQSYEKKEKSSSRKPAMAVFIPSTNSSRDEVNDDTPVLFSNELALALERKSKF